ncbi:hypothetical protein GCM10009022_36780 [Vreelandella titanicae]
MQRARGRRGKAPPVASKINHGSVIVERGWLFTKSYSQKAIHKNGHPKVPAFE